MNWNKAESKHTDKEKKNFELKLNESNRIPRREKLERIKIELFANELPKTSENFRQFCTGEYRELSRPVGYKNSIIHRVVKDFVIQGGDFAKGNGTGSKTIFVSSVFEDEGFPFDHTRYAVSMANAGPNTNGSQFFICTNDAPQLDGKHVVFGKVIDGFSSIDKINNLKVDASDHPISNVVIVECGEM